jgi:hypothetical protein
MTEAQGVELLALLQVLIETVQYVGAVLVGSLLSLHLIAWRG